MACGGMAYSRVPTLLTLRTINLSSYPISYPVAAERSRESVVLLSGMKFRSGSGS